MAEQGNNQETLDERNIISEITFKYLPYWPLFIIMILFCMGAAFLYLRYAVPVYEVTASLMVKDEKKGLDDSKILESLNLFGGKKIVENEIEVLHSRALMRKVVQDLHLYAPLFQDGLWTT